VSVYFIKLRPCSLSSFIAEQVNTFALQVHVPASYQGPQDTPLLGTVFLGYIPADQVDTLAAMIKAKNSAFYTGTSGVPEQLAARVDSGFAINSITDPNVPNKDGAGGSSAKSSNQARIRQDAIIGVVSALGSITIVILAFLVYRSYSRRKELAHRRLSDPPVEHDGALVGHRPSGQDFDQDSVGGQRRRSFYYAEDSLRGFRAQEEEPATFDHRTSPTSMRERRPVVPAAISAPILRDNTMNW
jgi:hypothetical protein